MADLVITAANVIAVSSAKTKVGTAGASVTAGEPVYEDPADGRSWKPAQADAATTDLVVGVALHAAEDGQPLTVVYEGDYNPGATVVLGQVYVLSAAAAGGVAPISDLVSTNLVSILGVATTTSNIHLALNNSGVAKA